MDGFLGKVRNKGQRLSQGHPRYEWGNVRQSVRQVLQRVGAAFDVKVSSLKKGRPRRS